MQVIREIRAYNVGRYPERLRTKYQKKAPENFGSCKGNNRLACFDINNFDDALVPASWN